MRIRDMARLVAEQIAGGKIKVKMELEAPGITGYAPDTSLKLSAEKLRKLGWNPSKKLTEMYRDVIQELKIFDLQK